MTNNTSLTSSILTTLANITTLITTSPTTTIFNTTTALKGNETSCTDNYSSFTCRLATFIRILSYLLLSIALVPQIIHLIKHRARFIAGVSYMWIVIRVLALMSLSTANVFKYPSAFQTIALVSTLVIFVQIAKCSDSLHRQQLFTLVVSSLTVWIIGGLIMFLSRKNEAFLTMLGFSLLAVHMLPQILLNSLLRTTKALSKFTILFLALSDTLQFASYYTLNQSSIYLLITIYYAFSFFWFIYLQSTVYADSHIHLISRSAHTVLTPGVDIFTSLDANGSRSSGQEPQMFSIDDLEANDGTDVVYQPVTSAKPTPSSDEQTPIKRFVWYATLGSIFCIEILLTIMLIHRAWSLWIILVPISIPIILGIFYLLRTKLSILQVENLRKIL